MKKIFFLMLCIFFNIDFVHGMKQPSILDIIPLEVHGLMFKKLYDLVIKSRITDEKNVKNSLRVHVLLGKKLIDEFVLLKKACKTLENENGAFAYADFFSFNNVLQWKCEEKDVVIRMASRSSFLFYGSYMDEKDHKIILNRLKSTDKNEGMLIKVFPDNKTARIFQSIEAMEFLSQFSMVIGSYCLFGSFNPKILKLMIGMFGGGSVGLSISSIVRSFCNKFLGGEKTFFSF